MKTLTADFEAALRDKTLRVGFLAYIDHPSGPYYFWSGIGSLVYGGNTYVGISKLGRVQATGETSEVKTVDTSYQLLGASIDATAAAIIAQPIRGRIARFWFALFDEAWSIVSSPVLIDETILDHAVVSTGDDLTQVLSLNGTSAIFDFRRPARIAITNEQQQIDYPGDTGFDRIPTEVADKTVSWTYD